MLRIDKAILDTNNVICDNIAQLSTTDRGAIESKYSWPYSQLR